MGRKVKRVASEWKLTTEDGPVFVKTNMSLGNKKRKKNRGEPSLDRDGLLTKIASSDERT